MLSSRCNEKRRRPAAKRCSSVTTTSIVVGCLLCLLPSVLVSAFHIDVSVARPLSKRKMSAGSHRSRDVHLSRRQSLQMTASASEKEQPQAQSPPDKSSAENSMSISKATQVLTDFDARQQAFMQSDGMNGMGGGTSALTFLQTALSPADRQQIKAAVATLVQQAHLDRSKDSSKGRIMLGLCASNAPEALGGLKSWVTTLSLPRGMLHGMDVDGVPIPPEELGSVYVKFSTGGAMTFKQMRESKMGFDALWRPGDALLEPYDGDFRGVYLNVELEDGEFRQFGVLPTDLFMDMEENEW